jgi:peptide/nickel transport system substrate-binding protein
LRYLSGYRRIDDYTFELTLSQAVPFFEYNLTFPILSANYYGDDDFTNTDKNNAPIGTGMFKIDSVDSGKIKLVKNDVYWDNTKTPMAEEININLYSSMGEVYNAFKSGELDIITVTSNNVEEYIGTLGYNKIEYKSRDYDFLAFNTASDILSETAVRQAISKVIDKNSIVVSCLGSGYTASNFSLDMGNWLYTRDLTVEVNTDEARQILENNGWIYRNNTWTKDGKKLDINIMVNSNNEARVRVAEAIVEQLEQFGIKASVQQVSAERYNDALNNKNFECILAGIECSFSPSLHTFFGEGNLANYSNTEVLDLINKVENTTDEGVLYDSYKTLFDKYLEDVPYIGLYRSTDIVVYNQGLVGSISPNAFNLYHNIEKWYRQ